MNTNQSKTFTSNFTLLLDERVYISLDAEVLKDDVKFSICAPSLGSFSYKSAYCHFENDRPKKMEKYYIWQQISKKAYSRRTWNMELGF